LWFCHASTTLRPARNLGSHQQPRCLACPTNLACPCLRDSRLPRPHKSRCRHYLKFSTRPQPPLQQQAPPPPRLGKPGSRATAPAGGTTYFSAVKPSVIQLRVPPRSASSSPATTPSRPAACDFRITGSYHDSACAVSLGDSDTVITKASAL
jgi:hypothetical protein